MMHDSQITTAVAGDSTLHQRIQGVIASAMHSASLSDTERSLVPLIKPADVAVKVAANPSIIGAVKTALDAQTEDPSVADAIQTGLIDTDLKYVVLTELSFLAT